MSSIQAVGNHLEDKIKLSKLKSELLFSLALQANKLRSIKINLIFISFNNVKETLQELFSALPVNLP